jgi:hypothetical protein
MLMKKEIAEEHGSGECSIVAVAVTSVAFSSVAVLHLLIFQFSSESLAQQSSVAI